MSIAAVLQEIEEKGILCLLGFHDGWVMDQAAGFRVRRCGLCNEPDDVRAAHRVRVARYFSQFVPDSLAQSEWREWIREQTLQACARPAADPRHRYAVYMRPGT